MLALYHFGNAICAQKVRLALQEKGVAWESRDCSGPALRDSDYLKLNPNGVVPTLVHDHAVLIESRIISEYINDAFEGPDLMPLDPYERHRARLWSKQIDDGLHLNIFILSFVAGMREMFQKMPPEVRARALPGLRDPIKRRISEDLLEQGFNAPWVPIAADRFQRMIDEMQTWLERSPYLAGSTYSLADADYTAYLDRLTNLGLDVLWADKPGVQNWWDRMTVRQSYKAAILDWRPPADTERLKGARERYAADIARLIRAA